MKERKDPPSRFRSSGAIYPAVAAGVFAFGGLMAILKPIPFAMGGNVGGPAPSYNVVAGGNTTRGFGIFFLCIAALLAWQAVICMRREK